MSRNKKNSKKKIYKLLIAVCILVAICLLCGVLGFYVIPKMIDQMDAEPDTGKTELGTTSSESESIAQSTEEPPPTDTEVTSVSESDTGSSSSASEETTSAEPENVVAFPVVLDGGKIEIESLFQFSGINPDSENQEAKDVASISLANVSSDFLIEATVNVTFADGQSVSFVVSNLPSGASAMAFSLENATLLSSDSCVDIEVASTYTDDNCPDGVEISVEGMEITLSNSSSEDINKLSVYYRDVYDDKYFGGITYSYSIEHLSAGESTTFFAEKSLLGMVEVVRVAVNDEN